ncbi:hypothetical protein [Brucella pituitosa]|uniref:hypothetical protein n=1 Tax=Brucella pituitosa TaxID=571256 RepID=UPI0011B01FF5
MPLLADTEMKPDCVPQPKTAELNPVTASTIPRLAGHDLPVKQFMKQRERLIANSRENWNKDTAKGREDHCSYLLLHPHGTQRFVQQWHRPDSSGCVALALP